MNTTRQEKTEHRTKRQLQAQAHRGDRRQTRLELRQIMKSHGYKLQQEIEGGAR